MVAENPELARLIERLRGLPADDLAAIVARLSDVHRAKARSLLLGHEPNDDVGASVAAALSPWLADRLSQPDGLTSQAHRELQQCAGRLEMVKPGSSSPLRPSVFEQLRLVGRGRTTQPGKVVP